MRMRHAQQRRLPADASASRENGVTLHNRPGRGHACPRPATHVGVAPNLLYATIHAIHTQALLDNALDNLFVRYPTLCASYSSTLQSLQVDCTLLPVGISRARAGV